LERSRKKSCCCAVQEFPFRREFRTSVPGPSQNHRPYFRGRSPRVRRHILEVDRRISGGGGPGLESPVMFDKSRRAERFKAGRKNCFSRVLQPTGFLPRCSQDYNQFRVVREEVFARTRPSHSAAWPGSSRAARPLGPANSRARLDLPSSAWWRGAGPHTPN